MKRPKISQKVIDEFIKIIDSQDAKGFEKYGKSIDEADDKEYNWLLMALEEAADHAKYQQREILKLQKELLEAKNQIKNLQGNSRVSKCLQLETENLAFAKENSRLKELLIQNNIPMG